MDNIFSTLSTGTSVRKRKHDVSALNRGSSKNRKSSASEIDLFGVCAATSSSNKSEPAKDDSEDEVITKDHRELEVPGAKASNLPSASQDDEKATRNRYGYCPIHLMTPLSSLFPSFLYRACGYILLLSVAGLV